MEKIDYKKVHKSFYKASAKQPKIVDFPGLQYITISGIGSPDDEIFSESIQALYGIAYTISMSYKNSDFVIPNFNTFVCPPLEGHWSVQDGLDYDGIDKSVFKWDLRILMPDFVTPEVFLKAKTLVTSKKNNVKFKDVSLKRRPAKKYCVMMHIGAFAKEKDTFDIMESYTSNLDYNRLSKDHEEVYLSDFRKVEEDKLKTVLAFEVL